MQPPWNFAWNWKKNSNVWFQVRDKLHHSDIYLYAGGLKHCGISTELNFHEFGPFSGSALFSLVYGGLSHDVIPFKWLHHVETRHRWACWTCRPIRNSILSILVQKKWTTVAMIGTWCNWIVKCLANNHQPTQMTLISSLGGGERKSKKTAKGVQPPIDKSLSFNTPEVERSDVNLSGYKILTQQNIGNDCMPKIRQ